MKRPERPLLLVLALILALQCAYVIQLRRPAAKDVDAPPDQFSAARALVVLRRLLAEQVPHPTGSANNAVVRQRLVKELTDLGLEVEIQRSNRDRPAGRELYNVLARLPGASHEGRPLVLATHYDSVHAGPGAADAGSCVVALLETARVLRQAGSCQRPVYFLFTDGEEAGMMGASAFVAEHPLAKEDPFVLNFDARGTSGPSLMYETHHGNLAVVRLIARYLPAPRFTGSSYVTVYRLLPNDTDFSVFQRDNWIGLNFAFIDDAHRYHTAEDRIENLDPRSLQHHGQNALQIAKAVALRRDVSLTSPGQDAVFFDVMASSIVYYPVSWALPLAFLPLVVLLGVSANSLRTPAGRNSLLATAIVLLVSLAASVPLGSWLARGLVSLDVLPRTHVPHGPWIAQVYWLISIVLTVGLGRVMFRRASRRDVWIALWLLWSLAGVAVAWWLPGFSYLFLIPSAGAALLSIIPLSVNWKVTLSVLVAAVILIPLVNLFPVGLGPRAGMILCPVFTLAFSTLSPWLVRQEVARGTERESDSDQVGCE